MVERLVNLTTDQESAGSNFNGGLNFRVSESALSIVPQAGMVIVTSAHPPGGM